MTEPTQNGRHSGKHFADGSGVTMDRFAVVLETTDGYILFVNPH